MNFDADLDPRVHNEYDAKLIYLWFVFEFFGYIVATKEYVLVIEGTASRCVFQRCVSPNLSARGGIFS